MFSRIRCGLVLVGLALVVTHQHVQATCTILPGGNDAHLEGSRAVFVGRAVSARFIRHTSEVKILETMTPSEPEIETTFEVTEVWKGAVPTVVHVRSINGMTGGYRFELGRRYVVFGEGEDRVEGRRGEGAAEEVGEDAAVVAEAGDGLGHGGVGHEDGQPERRGR